jgi:hypothetical protein
MCYQGHRNWPPRLMGMLKHAIRHDQFPNRCFLVIECNEQRFITSLMFDDPMFCEEIYEFLRHQCGNTIEEIGELDLIRTFG